MLPVVSLFGKHLWMKHILLSIIFVLIGIHLNAQVSISLNPDLVNVDVDPTQFETVAHAWVTNSSDEALTIKWVRTVESMTEMWESAVCDRNACWSTTIDETPEDQLIVLEPGDSSNLDVHIRPFGLDGSARIKLEVFDVNNEENRVEGTYLFNETTTATLDIQLEGLRIYPNPTIDYFQLTEYDGIHSITIFNLAGLQVTQYMVRPGEKFDVGNLNRGMYLVKLIDERNDIIKTLRLNKR